MVSPDGEPVNIRPAIRTLVVAVVDGIFVILLIMAWFKWPSLWFVWLVSIFFNIPLYYTLNHIFKLIPLKTDNQCEIGPNGRC
jgi:fatty acid desaturase